jgi:hypothetical protein
MSVQLETSEDRQRMTATVDPPRRKSPRRIFLRFRHPERMRLVSADVNGTPWGDFSPEKEWVVLPGMAEPFTVVGLFAPP